MKVAKSASTDYWPKHLSADQSARLRITRGLLRATANILFLRTTANLVVSGQGNIPRTSPVILVFNHVTLLDPIVVACGITVRGVVPLGKQELAANPLTGWVFWAWGAIPVKRGEVDRTALKRSVEIINSNEVLMISPEGHRQKHGMHDPKPGAVMLAAHTGAMLVPIGISGTEQYLHNVARLRRTKITANVGKPFRLKDGITRKQYLQAAHEIMYQIAPLVSPSLRGDYADLSKATMDTIEPVA
jgi:1-acyl-sn-glycerol-3-phosphate acyltransferase